MRVLVLDGNENHAVAAVRSLDRAGHEVLVGADTSWSKAGWSRHASETFRYVSPRTDPERFVDQLREIAGRRRHTLVLPMTESTTLPVSERRGRLLEADARLVLADHSNVLRALDKEETQRIASRAGLVTPRTRVVEDCEGVRSAIAEIGPPLVLKPHASEERGPEGTIRRGGAPRYAQSPDQAESAFNELREASSRIVVQEFIQGRGTGYYALMVHGEPRAEFAHLRLRDVRPTGSGSSLRVSIPIREEMRRAGQKVLQDLDWHGVAMVEFIRREDGELVFVEVNGRFWNSLALSISSGVDFPALVAEVAEHGDLERHRGYETGVRCRWILGDAQHLVAVLCGPPAGYPGSFPSRLGTLLSFVTPRRGTRHDNLTLTDPLPGLGDWAHFLLRRVPSALGIGSEP